MTTVNLIINYSITYVNNRFTIPSGFSFGCEDEALIQDYIYTKSLYY